MKKWFIRIFESRVVSESVNSGGLKICFERHGPPSHEASARHGPPSLEASNFAEASLDPPADTAVTAAGLDHEGGDPADAGPPSRVKRYEPGPLPEPTANYKHLAG